MKLKINYQFEKIKYINLNGGTSSTSTSTTTNNFPGIFEKTNQGDITASYIYTRNPNGGVYYFALARKVPYNARIRISGPNTGAASTDIKYMGKWGNFGGGAGVRITRLRAAINEINEEGDINPNINSSNHPYHLHHVSVDGNPDDNSNIRLTLRYFNNHGNKSVFLFEMEFQEFMEYFPHYPNVRGGANIVGRSKGEIDLVTSMSMQEIINKQNETKNIHKNDFLLSYCISTFKEHIIPAMGRISTTFREKKYGDQLTSHNNEDEANRSLPDPYGKKYQELPGRKYKDESKKK